MINFDPDNAYTVGVWDMPMYVYDHDEDDYVRNDDGNVVIVKKEELQLMGDAVTTIDKNEELLLG